MKPDVICGVTAVSALFARRPEAALRLFYVAELRQAAGPWCKHLAAARRPYRMVEAEELAKVTGTPHHGGIAVVAEPRAIVPFNPAAPPTADLLLVLDGIGNPHNLGAIARSAAFFGVPALLLHAVPGAALPSDAAYRTAAGGLEWLDVYATEDLPAALTALGPAWRTVAATLTRQARPLVELKRDRPIALVLGHEEHGVAPAVLAACQQQVKVVGARRVQSLNVAQAAAVFLHSLCG